MDAQQIQRLLARVDKIKIDLDEKNMQCMRLQSQAQIQEQQLT